MEPDDKPVEQIEVELEPKRRKRTAISQSTAVKKAELYVSRKLPKYLKKLEELAMGILIMKTDREGNEAVYAQAPDRAALEYLIDRGMGRAPQRFEIDANTGPPMLPQAWVPDELPPGVIEGEVKELPLAEEDHES